MDTLGHLTSIGAGGVAVIAALAAWFRWVRPFIRSARQDIVSGRDALLGRDEVRDSITGAVVLPALPGMGIRMDTNERQMKAVVDAVAQIAPALTQLADSRDRLDEHDRRITATEEQVAENARRIDDLRRAYTERVANHIESAAAFNAIGEIAKNNGTTEEPS